MRDGRWPWLCVLLALPSCTTVETGAWSDCAATGGNDAHVSRSASADDPSAVAAAPIAAPAPPDDRPPSTGEVARTGASSSADAGDGWHASVREASYRQKDDGAAVKSARGDRPAEIQNPAAIPLPPPAPPADESAEEPASQTPAAGSPLSLQMLEEMAMESNPTIAAAQALIQEEKGLYTQIGLYPNPQVGYLRSDTGDPTTSGTDGIFASQTFVTAGKLRLGRDMEAQDVRQRILQWEAQKQRVLNDLRVRYYEALGAQRTVRLAEELVGLAEEGVEVAEKLLKAKQGSKVDVLQAEIQLEAVRTTLEGARYRFQSAWKQLANMAGHSGMPPHPLAGELTEELPQLEWEQTLEQLLAGSPVLQAARTRIQRAHSQYQLAKAQVVPNVNAQVVWEHDRTNHYSTASTLISLPLPLYNRNQGNRMLAAAEINHATTETNRVQLALEDALAASFGNYLQAKYQAERLKQDILPRAKQNLDLTTEGYKAGEFDFLRVLTARQTYFRVNMGYIDALTAVHKSAVEVSGLLLTGGLNPTEIGTALQAQGMMGGGGRRSVLLQQLQEGQNQNLQRLPGAVQGR